MTTSYRSLSWKFGTYTRILNDVWIANLNQKQKGKIMSFFSKLRIFNRLKLIQIKFDCEIQQLKEQISNKVGHYEFKKFKFFVDNLTPYINYRIRYSNSLYKNQTKESLTEQGFVLKAYEDNVEIWVKNPCCQDQKNIKPEKKHVNKKYSNRS